LLLQAIILKEIDIEMRNKMAKLENI